MATEFLIGVDDNGSLQFIYDDELAVMLADLGTMETKRASHVEPCGNQWTADMNPVGGPVLGPYDLRGDALAAEVDWLKTNII